MYSTLQLVRFAIVGLLSNLLLFMLYLLATLAGAGHKSAMTVLYVLGVLTTFLFNRNWSFRHAGVVSTALLRYVLIYLVAYLINWTALYLLVDRAGWAHQWVQGAMILLLATALFLSQKFWAFKDGAAG